MGDFFGGAGQLIFDFLEHDAEYTPELALRQWQFNMRELMRSRMVGRVTVRRVQSIPKAYALARPLPSSFSWTFP
jgi:hypothetical protein